jgi:hypothetical protein
MPKRAQLIGKHLACWLNSRNVHGLKIDWTGWR